MFPPRCRPQSFRARLGWSLLLAAALGGCATGMGAGGLPDDPVLKDYEPKRWVGTPKSGLRIIVQEDHSSPLVSIVTSFGVGATSDPKGVEGLAHFVEHLVFRSKPFGGDQQYWDILKRTGGFFNASTSHDFTTYYTTAHKDQLELMLRLEAWRLMNTVGGVTEEVFKTEREVVRNELRQRWETTPGNRMFDLLFDSLYPEGHPLRTAVGGTHESLTASQLHHAQKFVKDHYRPDNCTITIVGDVDTTTVQNLLGTWPAELLFGPGGPDGPAVAPRPRVGERKAPPVPPPVTTKLTRHKGPIATPVLMLAWALPPGLRGHDALTDFAATRLNLALADLDMREEDDIMGAGSFGMPLADSSVIVMQAALRPWADPEKVRKRLLDVLVAAWATDFDRLITEAARWGSATDLLMRATDPLSTAAELSQYMSATGKPNYFTDHFEELAKIDKTEVNEFVNRWLKRERAVAVYFEPESDQVPKMGSGAGAGGTAGPGAGGESASHNIGRGIAPNAGELTSEKLLSFVRAPGVAKLPTFKTSNGVQVFVVERPEVPTASVLLRMRGGNSSIRPVGAASLANALARSTCTRYKGLREVGGGIGGGVGLASTTYRASVFAGNLPNAMAALRDRVSCMEVSDEAFLHVPRLAEQDGRVFRKLEVYPDFIAGKWLMEQLYPGHPYAEEGHVNPVEYKSFRREEAQAFVSSVYQPGNATAVVFGGVTVEEVKQTSESFLATWSGGGGGGLGSIPVPPGPSERRIRLIDRPKATQATVNIGCRLPEITQDSYPAYDVLEAVLDESAWVIREQFGATYGIGAGVQRYTDGPVHLSMNGAIENAQAGVSLGRLLKVIEAIGKGTIADGLVITKRWDVGREFMNRFATADALAAGVLTARAYGWPLEFWDRYPQNLATVTRDSLKQIVAPCLGKEVIAIVGDASVLRPQLEAEGLKVSAN